MWILLGIIGVLVIVVIVLGISTCAGTVGVPDVKGLTLTEGVTALEDAGLRLGEVTYSSDVPAGITQGQIASQTPTAGEQVDEGTRVDLVLAGEAGGSEVPDVVGMNADDATEALAEAGFIAKVVEVEDNSDAGTVIDQSPEAGTTAPAGTEVTLKVSTGPAATSVPNVVGKTEEEATSILQDAGFEVEPITTYDDKVAQGLVISQAPEAGSPAAPGVLVTIVVSNGKNPETKVPSVVGKTETDAAQIIADAGFQVVSTSSYSPTVPATIVISQNPEADTTALVGSAVTIAVSMGPEPPKTAVVPDVIGKTEAEATQALTAAGYQVAVVRSYSDNVAKDLVAAQVPVAGSVTEPGITVGLIVSDGSRPDQGFVVVPDVSGMTIDDATAMLAETGLKVSSFEWFTQLAPEGQIFAQLPPAGSSVAPDSTVLVLVSKGPYLQVNPQ